MQRHYTHQFSRNVQSKSICLEILSPSAFTKHPSQSTQEASFPSASYTPSNSHNSMRSSDTPDAWPSAMNWERSEGLNSSCGTMLVVFRDPEEQDDNDALQAIEAIKDNSIMRSGLPGYLRMGACLRQFLPAPLRTNTDDMPCY